MGKRTTWQAIPPGSRRSLCDGGDGVIKTRNHDIGASPFAIRESGPLIGEEGRGMQVLKEVSLT